MLYFVVSKFLVSVQNDLCILFFVKVFFFLANLPIYLIMLLFKWRFSFSVEHTAVAVSIQYIRIWSVFIFNVSAEWKEGGFQQLSVVYFDNFGCDFKDMIFCWMFVVYAFNDPRARLTIFFTVNRLEIRSFWWSLPQARSAQPSHKVTMLSKAV